MTTAVSYEDNTCTDEAPCVRRQIIPLVARRCSGHGCGRLERCVVADSNTNLHRFSPTVKVERYTLDLRGRGVDSKRNGTSFSFLSRFCSRSTRTLTSHGVRENLRGSRSG